jgi:flagellar basal body-associated protein FliL
MAIKSIEEKKKQTILLILALVIFIAAFAVFYFGYLKKRGNVPVVEQQAAPESQISSAVLDQHLEKMSLDVDFLAKTILSFLKTHGNLPVTKGATGRINPFTAP